MLSKVLKSIAIVALLVATVSVLLAKPRAAAQSADGRTTILYWEKWTGEEADAMRKVVDQFNATVGKEKNIYVEFVSMSQVDQKTLVATAAGVPPDIAGLWDNQLTQFAGMDALMPLDDLAAAHGISAATYKPIYWNGLNYRGHLWGLISTPAAVALHYNKQSFLDAGLDPDHPPTTLAEFDADAKKLTTYDDTGKHIVSAGYIPLEPGWFISQTSLWFGGDVYDPATQTLALDSKPVRDAFDWIASYSRTFGKDAVSDFRSGIGNGGATQNPFFTGNVVMEQQGPWMAGMIEHNAPALNRWHVPAEALKREAAILQLKIGMTHAEIVKILGQPVGATPASPAERVQPPTGDAGVAPTWDAGVRQILITFDGDKATKIETPLLPAIERRKYCQWAAAPFPSATGAKNVTLANFDCLVIPRGCKHPDEAFEFLSYVTSQPVMEQLCADHCKNSPLRQVSKNFIDYHPNAYIQVFEDLAASPNARGVPQTPIWPQMTDELSVAAQKCYLLTQTPEQALKEAADRTQVQLDYFKQVQAARQSAKAN